MSSYNPPIENVPIFDSSLFRDTNSEGTLTITQADKRYLKFPIAQGNETLQGATISGALVANSTSTFNGTSAFNAIATFNDDITIADGVDTSTISMNNASNLLKIRNNVNSGLIQLSNTDSGGFETINMALSSTTFNVNTNTSGYVSAGGATLNFSASGITLSGADTTIANKNLIVSDTTNNGKLTIDQQAVDTYISNNLTSGTIFLQTKNGGGVLNDTLAISSGSNGIVAGTKLDMDGNFIDRVGSVIYNGDGTTQTSAYTGAGASAGSYTLSNITLDANGKITAISSGSATSIVPVGSTIAYAGANTPPTGWLFCQGQAVSRTTYSALFAVIGSLYGNGDGSTTFNLPKMMSGDNNYGIFPAGSAQTTNNGFIVNGGSVNVVYLPKISNANQTNQQISFLQTPNHSHDITFPTANYVNNVNTTNNTTTGGSGARAVNGSQSTFPTATDTINYGNLKTQADYVPIYTAFCWIIKY